MDSDLLRALAYTGFLLNLINLAPIGILDGGHVLHSWRVLRAGAGAATAEQARWRANAVAIASILTAVALVAGMVLAHVPQDRL
jgi:membrane-associated protease RseP (regulator of RpoE activity)